MYEKFFELKSRPFPSTPNGACFHHTPSHDEALALLRFCITEKEGVAVLIGAAGLGKTLLAHLLIESLPADTQAVVITNTHLRSVHSLLQALCYDLSIPFEACSEQELRLRLVDFLVQRFADGGKTLFVIDEAHHLDAEQLEELRLLLNLESGDEKAVQLILCGQEPLLATLDDPQLESFRQRVAVVAKLRPLTNEQAIDYVRSLIAKAGASADTIFTADALSEICDLCEGIPRRINQLAHRSLLLAYANESGLIDSTFMLAAAEQLLLKPAKADGSLLGLASELESPPVELDWRSSEPDALPTIVEIGVGAPTLRLADEKPTRSDAGPATVPIANLSSEKLAPGKSTPKLRPLHNANRRA